MPMISNQMNVFCEIHFIFRENSILLQGNSLPDEGIARKCLELNVAEDWFAELEYGYSALLLEKEVIFAEDIERILGPKVKPDGDERTEQTAEEEHE